MQDPIQNITKGKRTRCLAQVVEHLTNKHEALNSNSVTEKGKKQKKTSPSQKRLLENEKETRLGENQHNKYI
jgi:hypothetical protein